MSVAEVAAAATTTTAAPEERAMLPMHVVAPNGEKTLYLVSDPRPGVCEQFMANMPGYRAYPVDSREPERAAG